MNEEEEISIEGKRVALYVRVSSEEQAKHGLSLPEQEHELNKYAQEHGAIIVDTYKDEGKSAYKHLKYRYELQRLLKDIEADKIDIVLFIKLDRWFRNVKDYENTQAILKAHHVKWIATQEHYNTSTANGELWLSIRLAIARAESKQLSERIRFVRQKLKREKKALTGKLLYGYKRDKETKKIVIDETQAPLIRDMFHLCIDGFSVPQIADQLAEKYGVRWYLRVYYQKLRNEKYIGTFYGVTDYAPPIVDAETFSRVQSVMESRRTTTPNKKYIYLFTGLLFCPNCNHRMTGLTINRTYTRKRDSKTVQYRAQRYRCANHYINKTCDFKQLVSETGLENYLVKHLQQELQKYSDAVYKNDNIDLIKAKAQNIKEKLERLSIVYVNGTVSEETYNKLSNDYKRQLAELQNHYTIAKPTETMQSIIANGIPSIYNELSKQGKKQFWHAILKRIDIVYDKSDLARDFVYKLTFL